MNTEGTQPEVSNNDDLFGESTTAVAEPEQETGIEEPSGEAEAEVATEPEESTEVAEEAATEAEAQSDADPELDTFLAKKKIDRDKFNEYAERYQVSPAMLKANPSLRYLVLDKINADGALEATKRPAEEPKKQEEPQKQVANPADHVKNTIQAVAKYNDANVLKAYVDEFSAAGEKGDAVAQFQVLSAAANNLIETVVPQLVESRLEQILEKVVPGFVGNYRSFQVSQQAENTWKEMRSENSQLPESFAELEQAALKKMPSLGKVELPLRERLEAYVALSAGQKVDPVTVEKAATKIADKKLEATKVAEKAKGLGAGKSNSAMNQKTSGNDDIFGRLDENPINQRLIGKTT